ncbi:hypothetical protein TanjilG_09734 [Lupinus angustifolius]|uniref:Uncharacterized protein n=1 Tax=Lupinus angustifolius TaxID=3871 RepID=A0A4P1QWQ7_LUPAN|nr:PREDICTED: uncharacterized protein LOC109327975 isoform X2 [Lupinus angustifolius]OIV96307.1 hypothetical protein TanjilG_09734 [Lupinus angustifolius]
MSRCFPFPPPGYTRNSDALIESIKLQSEIKKSKKDRKKERRREKKGKESKKEKRKDRKGEEGTSFYANEGGKKIKVDELEKQSGCVSERVYNENERVERSDITEEHYRSVTTLDPCCSDSTLSSIKRKRSISPSRCDHGTKKKFRFSLTKHTAPEESKLGSSVCASRIVGTADSLTRDAVGANPPLPHITRTKIDHCPRDSRHCVALQSLPNGAARNTNVVVDDEGMRMVSMYNSLIQNWIPPPATCIGFDSDGQDWLFRSEQQEERRASKTVKVVTATLSCSSSSLWPRAQYLPEVELYALPYTVPF